MIRYQNGIPLGGHSLGGTHFNTNTPPVEEEEDPRIMEVWQSNVFEAFRQIREVVKHYPYVSMDTEFPGVVARPIGDFNTTSDYQYQVGYKFKRIQAHTIIFSLSDVMLIY